MDNETTARAKGRTGEQGFSLTEMLVALGIAALVIIGASTMIVHTQGSSGVQDARVSADQEAAQIMAMLGKDMDYIDLTNSVLVSTTPTQLTIVTQTGPLTYTSSCVDVPTGLSKYSFQGATSFGCLPSSACPQGKMPVLAVTRPAPQTAKVYPLFFGSGKRGATHKAVGTMACFSSTPNTLNVQLASFYVGIDNKMKAIARNLSLPIGNTSGVQVIRVP